jgi:hypothetical protein
MKVLILQSSKSAMQSAQYQNNWNIISAHNKVANCIKNYSWSRSQQSLSALNLSFNTLDIAINFAVENNWQYEVIKSHARTILPKSYAKNFK